MRGGVVIATRRHGDGRRAAVETAVEPRRDGSTCANAVGEARRSIELLQRENNTLRLLVAIHDRLGALVLEGADAAAITVALSELVDRPVLLLDSLLRPVDAGAARADEGAERSRLLWDPNDAYVGRVLQTMAGERRSMRLPPLPAWGVNHGCVLAPVLVGDATLGYLAILESEQLTLRSAVAEAELLAAQHAASVYALALMRERLAAEVTTELRDELLEGLLVGQVTDEQATRERARRLGYDEALYATACSSSCRTKTATAASPLAGDGAGPRAGAGVCWTASRSSCATGRPSAIVSRRRDELVVLLPDGPGATAPRTSGAPSRCTSPRCTRSGR